MKKNTKKSLGFLALLLMVGLVVSFTPGLISAQEGDAPAATADCIPNGLIEGNAEGTFYGRHMNRAKVNGAVNAPAVGNVDATPIGLGVGYMNGAVNAPAVGNVDSAPIGSANGTEDGLRIRQNLQDGTAAGGQQRARSNVNAVDGINCLTDTVPED